MERLEECVSFLLGKAYQQVNLTARQRLTPHGVTPVQYAVLRALAERAGQSGAELGERLRLDSATITGLLDRLEQAGLLERRPDAADRRANRVHLTQRARALQPALDQVMDELNADILGGFQATEAQQLVNQLAALGGVDRRG